MKHSDTSMPRQLDALHSITASPTPRRPGMEGAFSSTDFVVVHFFQFSRFIFECPILKILMESTVYYVHFSFSFHTLHTFLALSEATTEICYINLTNRRKSSWLAAAASRASKACVLVWQSLLHSYSLRNRLTVQSQIVATTHKSRGNGQHIHKKKGNGQCHLTQYTLTN